MTPAAFEFIQNHPLYGVAAGLLALFIVLTVIKKLVGWALVLVVAFLGYNYFLHMKGMEERSPAELLHRAEDAAEKAVKQAAEKAAERAEEALEKK
jgi:hypothetical protein